MAINELNSLFVSAVACVVVGAGFAWQMLRRKSALRKPRQRRIERIASVERAPDLPNAAPEQGAVEKPEAVLAFEQVAVHRPTMLAVTTVRGNASASEVFIQRAFKIDRPHWRALAVSQSEKRSLDCLFENVCKLAWVPGSQFERHIYAVNFSPVLEQGLLSGALPHVNASAADLQLCAIDATGTQLGQPMLTADHSWGELPLVQALWCALNPTDKPHELENELCSEIDILRRHTQDLSSHVSSVTARIWSQRLDALVDLSHDIRRIGAQTGQAAERNRRIDALAEQVSEDADRIDAAIVEQTESMQTIEDALQALQLAIPYMYIRELVVRVRRICAILRIMAGDSYDQEVRCANHVSSDITRFPDVRGLIDRARGLAEVTLTQASAAMNDIEIAHAGTVVCQARELVALHDLYLEQLTDDLQRIQSDIDRSLFWQTRPHRYAVRLDDSNRIEELYVLEG